MTKTDEMIAAEIGRDISDVLRRYSNVDIGDALVEALARRIAAALSAARREEREAVVTYLRERVGGGEFGGGFAKLATSIERGDHAR